MKYLRKYNEGNDVTEESVIDFCETSLAYLIDEGVTLETYANNVFIEVRILFRGTEVTWGEMKDHTIPFLLRLMDKYELRVLEDNNNFFFCMKIEGGSVVDFMLSCDDVKNIDNELEAHERLVMDEILFYIKL